MPKCRGISGSRKVAAGSAAFIALLLLVVLAMAADSRKMPAARPMKLYQTKYYVIHSDIDADAIPEIAARMNAMAEEYHARTKSFAGRINERMNFYLYSRLEDYLAAGGPKGSAGCYNSKELMAFVGPETGGQAWEVIQHEAFHQFSHKVIRAHFPVCIEEGLAEYFGTSLFTGDGFVSGVIPPGMLAEVQAMIKSGKNKTTEQMFAITYDQWVDKIDHANYLQSWSMVQFLAHGDDGKYQEPFERLLKAMSKGSDWRSAWKTQFRVSAETFDKNWARWWQELPRNPTADLYDKAAVATVTSFYARAVAQKQTFASMDEFFAAAGAEKLKISREDWLPPTLLASQLQRARALGTWSLSADRGRPAQLCCTRRDGTQFIGQFTLKGPRVDKVSVQVRKSTTQPAGPGL